MTIRAFVFTATISILHVAPCAAVHTHDGALILGSVHMTRDAPVAAASLAASHFTVSASSMSTSPALARAASVVVKEKLPLRGGQYVLRLAGASPGQSMSMDASLSVHVAFTTGEEALVWRETISTVELTNGFASERNVTVTSSVLEVAHAEALQGNTSDTSNTCACASIHAVGRVEHIALCAVIALILVFGWTRRVSINEDEERCEKASSPHTPTSPSNRLAACGVRTLEPRPDTDDKEDEADQRRRRWDHDDDGTLHDALKAAEAATAGVAYPASHAKRRRHTLPYWLRSSKPLSDGSSEDDDGDGECTSPSHLVHPKVEELQTALGCYMQKHGLDHLPLADDNTNDNGNEDEDEEESDYDV